jgi:hypothetical protein
MIMGTFIDGALDDGLTKGYHGTLAASAQIILFLDILVTYYLIYLPTYPPTYIQDLST